MSDLFYNFVWTIGWAIIKITSDPVVLGVRHTSRQGAYIIACNHGSPFDVPLLMKNTRRQLDFVSITEVFAVPFLGWFYGSMNAFPLDRSRRDSPTVRIILDRLARGRVIAMFPEGRIRRGSDSMLNGGTIRSGVGRLAAIANVPVIPAVVLNSAAYLKFENWFPHNIIRYGVSFGEPLYARTDLPTDEAGKELEVRLVAAMRGLDVELRRAMVGIAGREK